MQETLPYLQVQTANTIFTKRELFLSSRVLKKYDPLLSKSQFSFPRKYILTIKSSHFHVSEGVTLRISSFVSFIHLLELLRRINTAKLE